MAARAFAWVEATLRTSQGAESPNNSMQRTALRAAADAERQLDKDWAQIPRVRREYGRRSHVRPHAELDSRSPQAHPPR